MTLLNADEGTRLILRQQHRRRHDLIHKIFLLIAGQRTDAGEYVGLAKTFKQAADLLLENDDDSQEAPVDKDIGKMLQRTHAEKAGSPVNHKDDENALEDLNRLARFADQLNCII